MGSDGGLLRAAKLVLLGATPLLLLSSCGKAAHNSSYLSELSKWRDHRLERLSSPYGWLSLAGLYWLEEGKELTFGSAPNAGIHIEAEDVPPVAGSFMMEGGAVYLKNPASQVRVEGPVGEDGLLYDDSNDKPSIVWVKSYRMLVINREGRLGIRVRTPNSKTRTHFWGIPYYPANPAYRVRATLEVFSEPKKVQVASATGTPQTLTSPGLLKFKLKGKDCSLLAFSEGDELFLIFADKTTGTTTYGGGRFLVAEKAGDQWLLDFNKAYNPPCAFTPYATCPRPPEDNYLPVAVQAGEKLPPGTHHSHKQHEEVKG